MSNPPRDGKGSVRKCAAEGKGIPAEVRLPFPRRSCGNNIRMTVTVRDALFIPLPRLSAGRKTPGIRRQSRLFLAFMK